MRKPNLKNCFFLLILISLQACKPGVWSNSNISEGKRDDFHAMNANVMRALLINNTDSIGIYLSKELIDNPSTLRQSELLSNALKADNFSLLDEYYIVKDYKHADSTTYIKSSRKGNGAYTLSFTGPVGDAYIALFLPKKGDNRYLICLEYYKYNYGWKLSSLDMGAYNVGGKAAPELYTLAKAEYAKGYLANALNAMQLANYCMQPCQLWQYPQEKEMDKFNSDVLAEANNRYKFPLVMDKVATHPKIFNITNTSIDGKEYPTVYYISTIKVSDTTSLKKENENIKKVIEQLVPGIDKDKSDLVYAAYNEMPSANKVVAHFDMIEKF
jgi:hypothetical protein